MGDKRKKSKRNEFKRILEPKSIAIIGVSREGFGFGRGILKSLIDIGYEGSLYPVNPRGGEIFGFNLYQSVNDTPYDIDLGIIAIPANKALEQVEAYRLKGVAGVEILSSGFSETGTPVGKALEMQLKELSEKTIIVVLPDYKQEISALEVSEMIRETREKLINRGIPVFDELGEAINTLGKVSLYYRNRYRRRKAYAS